MQRERERVTERKTKCATHEVRQENVPRSFQDHWGGPRSPPSPGPQRAPCHHRAWVHRRAWVPAGPGTAGSNIYLLYLM